jgi:hypothetical protein
MDVEVWVDGEEVTVLETVDISNGGAFIKVEPNQCPAVGTVLSLKVKGQLGGEEPPTVRAKVVRATPDGIGVEFLDT